MREVLALILRTVGPWTVMRYLDFAIGHGLGEEEWDGQTEAGARGLEELGRTMRVRRESEISDPEDMKGGDENGKVGGPDLARAVSHSSTFTLRGTPRLGMTITSQHEDSTTPDDPELLPHFYGFASNEIGEACICYLSRWGMDLLVHELANPGSPPIFGHRGLPARFVAALLGTDLFWVKDEMERYRAARKILDLRRRGWQEEMDGRGDLSGGVDEEDRDWEEDEVEMGKVFAEGIHYTHIVGPAVSMTQETG